MMRQLEDANGELKHHSMNHAGLNDMIEEELGAEDEEEDLCTESSWDPDEDDDSEVQDNLISEQEKKRHTYKGKRNRLGDDQDEDAYGYEDCDYGDEDNPYYEEEKGSWRGDSDNEDDEQEDGIAFQPDD
jgi:hypothetical protein